jgi:hypothetical protein
MKSIWKQKREQQKFSFNLNIILLIIFSGLWIYNLNIILNLLTK